MNDNANTGIYCWRNKVNNKFYVGQAVRSFRDRRLSHLSSLRKGNSHCPHLQAAWNKYGENNFEWLILHICPIAECVTWEQYWIDKLRAANREYGYNAAPASGSNLGIKFSDESRARMSDAQKKSSARPEVKAKRSESQKKAKSSIEYKSSQSEKAKIAHANPETKKKHRAALKKTYSDPEVRLKQSVRVKELMADPEVKARHKEGIRKANDDPEVSARRSEARRKVWAKRRALGLKNKYSKKAM